MGTFKLNKKTNIAGGEVKEVKQADMAPAVIMPEGKNEISAEVAPDVNDVKKFADFGGSDGELKEKRTPNVSVYKQKDGTCRKVITGAPTRYYDGNGELKEIKNALTDNGGEIVNVENSYKVKFDKSAEHSKIFELQKGENVLTLSAAGSANARGHVCGCKCDLCADAANTVSATLDDGTEIEYAVLNDRVKENIIIREKQDKYEYGFTLDVGDLAVEEGEHKELYLKDKTTGKTEFTIPAPFMYDANGVLSGKVSYSIAVNGGKLDIKVVADEGFINAEGRAFPVTIDPQIIVNNAGLFYFLTTDSQADRDDYYEGWLQVFRDNFDEVMFVEIDIDPAKIPKTDNIKKVELQLTAMEGAKGVFEFNSNRIDCIAVPGKTYRFDVTDILTAIYPKRYYISADFNTDVTFYNKGEYMPCLVITTEGEEEEVPQNLKTVRLGDSAEGVIDLNKAIVTTVFEDLSIDAATLPLSVKHVHRPDTGNSGYGLNWRLSLNKRLTVAPGDDEHTTKYIYVDEYGDEHKLSEKYYYIEDGRNVFVTKDSVKIDLNGNLTRGGRKIHRLQSCKGYTLISEVNDFIDSSLIEQRQDKQIQLEENIRQLKNTLKPYVLVNVETGQVVHYNWSVTKAQYNKYLQVLKTSQVCKLMTEDEASQLKSLKASKGQMEVQIAKLDDEIKKFAGVMEENKDHTTIENGEEVIDKEKEAAYKEAKKQKEYLEKQQKYTQYQLTELVNYQLSYLTYTDNDEFVQIKQAYENYFNQLVQLDWLVKQIPVNYIRDNDGVISGFNKAGDLVCVFDSYGNALYIEYSSDGKISAISDDKGIKATFAYADGLLQSVTDGFGNAVNYGYDGEKLIKVTFAGGKFIDLEYASDSMRTITSSDGVQAKLAHKNGKLTNIINSDEITETSFAFTSNGVTVADDAGSYEQFTFGEDKKLKTYKQHKPTGEETVTEYTYASFVDTKEVQTVTVNNIDNRKVKVTEKYNDLDSIISKTEDWCRISDTARQKTETTYEYDANNKPVKEVCIKSTEVSGTVTEVKSITEYNYNAQGSLILTKSYVEGEESTAGVNCESRDYDENGNLLRTVSWNSLDSSSKFYSESVRDENGRVIAEKDEAGEVSAEYEYVNGANAVNSVKYASGGKIAYGTDPVTGEVTAITQSTEDGEANATDLVYEKGLPVKVKSGNTVIDYTYDDKGRKKSVTVNGALHSEYSYENNKSLSDGGFLFEKTSQTVHVDDETFKSVYTKKGISDDAQRLKVHEKLTVGKDELYCKITGADGNLQEVSYTGLTQKTVLYSYDNFHRLTKAETSGGTLTENYVYNALGEMVQKSITGAVTQAYSYTYKPAAIGGLDNIAFGDYKFKPLTDVNGRSTGKEIYSGEDKLAAEYITYRKVGDHATNMPACVWFGSGSDIKESIKYKYDKCGNICEITQNGHVFAKYSYDSIGRLVREDNKVLNKTTVYSYDANGNITERCEYDYTRKTGEDLSEQECTHYSYDYSGDRLMSYNGEAFAYNSIGNPITYRGKEAVWQYGTRLVGLGNVSFTYDGLGRRVQKNGIEFTYDNDGKLIKQSNGLEFVYDHTGVVGVIYNGQQYFYRKDIQGNIISILDNTGKVVVNYIYDSWGNHAITNATGEDITEGIGILNPFRYRGYYYDTETGLYYLQTRYYDPELGRFISQDNIDFADPETINGLNLYAYCANNPVMNIDPTGEFLIALLAILATLCVGTLIGGISGGITAAASGGDFWAGFAGGALSGLISTIGLGFGILVGGVGGLAIAAFAGFLGSFSGSVIQQGIESGWNNINWGSATISGLIGAFSNTLVFGFTNFVMRNSVGLFEHFFDKTVKFSTRIINILSVSPESLLLTGLFQVPVTFMQSIMEIVRNVIPKLSFNENYRRV